jgi:sulfite exporter TauE/SafE
MNPWVIILFTMALIVFGVDFLLRRKKWKENSKEEKISLIVNMFSVGPYIFLSFLGMLWGIVPGSPDTSFGEILYDMTLMMSGTYFLVAGAAVILSLVFRKSGKTKASIWINVIAFLYIAAVLAINSFASKVL